LEVSVRFLEFDFSDYPAIDHHCHPWRDDTRELSKIVFLSFMNEGGLSPQEASDPENLAHSEFTPMGRQIVHRLAKFLGCNPRLADVLEARNARTRSDYWKYSRELFEDANIEGMLIDDGYSEISVGSALKKTDYEEFREKSPVWIKRVSRIEPLFQEAVDQSSNFEDFVDRFDRAITEAVTKNGAIGFKSVIAYRSGLNIQKPTEADVRKDYEISRATRARGIKNIRDWYMHRVVRRAGELGVAVHIHSGMGDIDVVFKECSPMKLYDLLKDPETWKTKIFIIHAGYPFTQEAAFYANTLKNVYIDLSEMIPFAGVPGCIEKTQHILELAPPTRVVFGSDGHSIPEIHWAGARIGRQVLQEALATFVTAGVYDEDEAHEAAKLILAGNAKRVYKL
jgi:predicted TIM-barrel fold metal-dependent hydrolase